MTKTPEADVFEGHTIDANEYAVTGKLGHDLHNTTLQLGDIVPIVARCRITAIAHKNDDKRGLVRVHKFELVNGGLAGNEEIIDVILEQIRADIDAADGTPGLPLDPPSEGF